MNVDPEIITINEQVEIALAKDRYPSDVIRFVAITNLAAAWKPGIHNRKISQGKAKVI